MFILNDFSSSVKYNFPQTINSILFSESELYKFAEYLHLVPPQEFDLDVSSSYEKNYLIEMIVSVSSI